MIGQTAAPNFEIRAPRAVSTVARVEKELLDVATTALAAVKHLRKNDRSSIDLLRAHLAGCLSARA